uniref:NPTX1 n=1 Tax=Malurus cyaneus samueli TaxID=2593467 RepID=A0A8C5UHE8_9PASS
GAMPRAARQPPPTRFICTSVPLDGDVCAASALGTGSAEELKGTVLQLRETVLQQKETIMNQKETIRELTAKLGRCESQSVLEPSGEGKGRKGFSKNTMGDLSRPAAAETLSQLGQTLQSLKTRLENLEQFSRMNSSSQTNNLKDILQNKIDDLEKQVLSRVNSLEEGKLNPRNESEERGKIESTLTSLHQRISDLEKGQKDNRPPDRFQLTFPLRTNYMYAKVKKRYIELSVASAAPGPGPGGARPLHGSWCEKKTPKPSRVNNLSSSRAPAHIGHHRHNLLRTARPWHRFNLQPQVRWICQKKPRKGVMSTQCT